jgi:hypothetical protein
MPYGIRKGERERERKEKGEEEEEEEKRRDEKESCRLPCPHHVAVACPFVVDEWLHSRGIIFSEQEDDRKH